MHSSQLFRRIRSEEMDISKRHFVKKREISKISFQQRIRIVIDQKHFYISNGKKKIVAGQMNIFCFKIFRQKISHATNSLHQRENKKTSFFFLIVKLFCHFMIDCSAEKSANSCFLPVDVFCEILPFILGNSSSDLHRVFFVFVQL